MITSYNLSLNHVQVECKKAQPKEVMLPANLAKGRAAAAARGLGEFLMVTNGVNSINAAAGHGTALRYSPYTLPTTTTMSTLELSPGPGSGCSSTPTPTPVTLGQHSNQLATISNTNGNLQPSNFHQALMQANLQQLQILGVDFGSPGNTAVSSGHSMNTLFGSVGCKPRSLTFPAVTSQNSFGYNMADLMSIPGPGYPGIDASSYQVPVGL